MFEVFLDPRRLTLHAAQVPCGGLDQLPLGTSRGQFGDRLLEVGIDHFVGIEFGAVTGQIEHLIVLSVLGQPPLDGLTGCTRMLSRISNTFFFWPLIRRLKKSIKMAEFK